MDMGKHRILKMGLGSSSQPLETQAHAANASGIPSKSVRFKMDKSYFIPTSFSLQKQDHTFYSLFYFRF